MNWKLNRIWIIESNWQSLNQNWIVVQTSLNSSFLDQWNFTSTVKQRPKMINKTFCCGHGWLGHYVKVKSWMRPLNQFRHDKALNLFKGLIFKWCWSPTRPTALKKFQHNQKIFAYHLEINITSATSRRERRYHDSLSLNWDSLWTTLTRSSLCNSMDFCGLIKQR